MLGSNDSQSKLCASVFAPKAAASTNDDEFADSDLPDTSGPYQAFGRPANRPVYTLHCCLGKDGYRSFQTVHLDSDNSFKTSPSGHVITLRFAGTQVMQVTIKGRNLRGLYDYLHQHRIPWVMRADRDLADDQEAIITVIEFAGIELL